LRPVQPFLIGVLSTARLPRDETLSAGCRRGQRVVAAFVTATDRPAPRWESPGLRSGALVGPGRPRLGTSSEPE